MVYPGVGLVEVCIPFLGVGTYPIFTNLFFETPKHDRWLAYRRTGVIHMPQNHRRTTDKYLLK